MTDRKRRVTADMMVTPMRSYIVPLIETAAGQSLQTDHFWYSDDIHGDDHLIEKLFGQTAKSKAASRTGSCHLQALIDAHLVLFMEPPSPDGQFISSKDLRFIPRHGIEDIE